MRKKIEDNSVHTLELESKITKLEKENQQLKEKIKRLEEFLAFIQEPLMVEQIQNRSNIQQI